MLDIKSLSDNLEEPSGRRAAKVLDGKKVPNAEKTPNHELIITQLTEGVRNRNRINVFINQKFYFSLDIKQIVDLQIKVGKKLTEKELQDLQAASEFGKLYQHALEWVLTRPRSVWETRDYLRRRQLKRTQLNRKRVQEEHKPLPEIQDAATDLVLERLIERGYVDDYKFAEYFVENRFVKKGVSERRLSLELRRKGISENIIAQVLQQSKRNDKSELIKMINKKRARYSEEKLIAYLVRQGFEYQLVRETLEQMSNENSEANF